MEESRFFKKALGGISGAKVLDVATGRVVRLAHKLKSPVFSTFGILSL
jgi:hypothetical protein